MNIAPLRELLDALVGGTAPALVALDGRSGSGKSGTAGEIAAAYDAVVVEGDDFYVGGSDADWLKRTPAERVAACIDWRRLRAQALEPLLAGRAAAWRPFDFAAGSGLAAREVSREPATIIVLDGIYSSRPELADLVGASILLRVPEDERRARLRAREGAAFMTRWHAIWDAAEDHYFTHLRPPETFDLAVGA